MENSVLQHFFPATLRDFFHKVYGLCILYYRKCLENRFFLQHKVDSDIFLLSHLEETSQEFLYCFLLFFFHHRCSKNILGISVLFLLFFFPHRCTRNILGISLFFVVLFPPQMQKKHLRNISVFFCSFSTIDVAETSQEYLCFLVFFSTIDVAETSQEFLYYFLLFFFQQHVCTSRRTRQ